MKPNPRLEILRASVPSSPDLSPMYKRWLESSENVMWARCLGYRPGWRANRVICRLIDATNPGHGDWKDLASELGLQYVDMKRIENTFGREGPTCRVLEEFVNQDNPSVGELLKALRRLGRDDVLLVISPYLDEFLQLHASGYPPLPIDMTDDADDSQSDSGVSSVRSITMSASSGPESRLLESARFQKAVCQDGHCGVEDKNMKEFEDDLEKAREFEEKTLEIPKLKNMENFKVVLLTFASDGQEYARSISSVFRRDRADLGKLGVLTLEENEEFLSVDPWGVVQRWFHEVDYIVPIITIEYLERISTRFTRSVDADSCVDARYVRLIYTLMCTEYTRRGCLNYRVRPLISNEVIGLLNQSVMLGNPLFLAWKKVEDSEKMATVLLKSPVRTTVL